MSIHLSSRLGAIAELVPPGARVIDVGTDHAMIPVWLAQTGRATHVWASDIRSGPLAGARELIEQTGTDDRIDLRLTDGLHGFTAEDGDTLILAGMGGETMASILSKASWPADNCLLILSPQSKQEVLRRFLMENGYRIQREQLVKDAGRLYPILVVTGGYPESYSPGELWVGKLDQIIGDPLFLEYLSQMIRRTEAAAPYDENARALLDEFREMEERGKTCQL